MDVVSVQKKLTPSLPQAEEQNKLDCLLLTDIFSLYLWSRPEASIGEH